MPIVNSPGPFLFLPKSTGKILRLVPETLPRFLRPHSLENFALPDGLTTRWLVDIYVTRVRNLERIYKENICQQLEITQDRTEHRCFSDMFSGAWDSFNLKKKNSRTEKFQSRSIGNLRDKQGIRIGKSLVPGD